MENNGIIKLKIEKKVVKEETPKKTKPSDISPVIIAQNKACKEYKSFVTRKFSREPVEIETIGGAPIKAMMWTSKEKANLKVKKKVKDKYAYECEKCLEGFEDRKKLFEHSKMHTSESVNENDEVKEDNGNQE
ncbi:Zinc finger C2H2 protein [Astathelohania contejeani]|uniref:Zinc finger C2H2 protein n=1 Tax=Astathelohania contejeani TaxID=164912 RepID=A0ABQ7HW36_9MICR|nr:Zinc finger C2H2 protein [Thelohania contejeani]